MRSKDIISALPLIADVLGKKYGVRVHIGGDRAYTNGKDIHLPSLPLDADELTLNLARGYLDHEAAHLRSTDFMAMTQAGLSAIEKHVWNILEDWMVEHKLAKIYPGCRHNLTWLIKHVFLEDDTTSNPEPGTDIFDWMLCSIRSLDVPKLQHKVSKLAQSVEKSFPGLLPSLTPIIQSVPKTCLDTKACIATSKKIVDIIQKYTQSLSQPSSPEDQANKPNPQNQGESNEIETRNQEGSHEQDRNAADHGDHQGTPTNISTLEKIKNLADILSAPADQLPPSFGDRLGSALEKISASTSQGLTVAKLRPKSNGPLSPIDINDAKKSSTALRTRIQGLLQSSVEVRNWTSRVGRIDARRLARMVTIADPKVFMRKGKRQGVNTAIHILLDSSGSMSGSPMELACKACYAVANALIQIPGISLAITSFPGAIDRNLPSSDQTFQSVSPILKRNDMLHNKFKISSGGCTPMAEALWWVLQEIHPLPEERKIILIISDGDPDSYEPTTQAIRTIKSLDIEVYGVGILSTAISRLLPAHHCRSISELGLLTPAMFGILQNALITNGR